MGKWHILFRLFVLYLTAFAASAMAHDFWLEAQPFYTKPGELVDISVHVGSEFVGDSLPNIPDWHSDFSRYQEDKKIPIEGGLGRDPAGHFKPEKKGTYIVAYQSDFNYVEIKPETFIQYLTEEGLDEAINIRKQNNLTDTIAKENYIRHVKTLVQSGDQFEIDQSAKVFNYELEIIPLENPYQKKIGETFQVKILYQNQPIKNILLIAFSKENPKQTQRVRTDKNGKAEITLNQADIWLLKAVKILQIEDEKADWQSHWASLTFSLTQLK